MRSNDQLVRDAVMAFLECYARKDVGACLSCFAESSAVIAFGTNLDEVFASRQEIQAGFERDFANMDKIGWGEARKFYIQAGEEIAIAMVELPIRYETGGKAEQLMLRYAFGLKKEAGSWKITAGSASVPTAPGNYDLAA